MEKICSTKHVRNEEVLHRVKEQRNILHEISKRKANWIDQILCRNCLLRKVIEGEKRSDRKDRKTRKET
jgi:heme exporter protein D